ncbi:MAG: bifunctional DNA-formamidopyrimidine glycosylase/DNA-(apurinic or apyrimidinic site) lyase [Firmicutes bacterium]|nr:bifunctional DNA-formamidopyrimidine glycosylase/DNA-(apurinic or apyrimidinic site) lyase [Bacillota bacterium]
MPELPEVETVARGLATVLPGRRIAAVRLGKTDFISDPAVLQASLPGCQIAAVRRYGKFLLFDLLPSNGAGRSGTLLVHLGMTGQLVVQPAAAPVAPHTHALLTLDDGRQLRYTDVRRFGRLALVSAEDLRASLAALGPDPLELSAAEFCTRLGRRRARIKSVLLDQRTLRGLGNIYVDESLWRAQIHPTEQAARLGPARLKRLYRAIRHILREAIRWRGSSIANYRDAAGAPGGYQQRHCVYGREGKPCLRCRAKIRRVLVAGRSSHYCPRCQRIPRRRQKAPSAVSRLAH